MLTPDYVRSVGALLDKLRPAFVPGPRHGCTQGARPSSISATMRTHDNEIVRPNIL